MGKAMAARMHTTIPAGPSKTRSHEGVESVKSTYLAIAMGIASAIM